ncbi:PKD domain-containing protein, partial [Glaciibacter flavus]
MPLASPRHFSAAPSSEVIMRTRLSMATRRLAMTTVFVLALGTSALAFSAPANAAEPGPAPIEQRNSSTVTADGLPTVQLDSGIVWAQDIVGNTVFAGGSFTNTRPAGAAPGTNLTPRANILAYDIRTGQLISSWAPTISGTVKSMKASPDGTRLYVGGTFNSVNGQTRFNFAALDTTTGALIPGFTASAGGSYVNAIAATDTAVYVGGLIGAANGVPRKNLAAFNTSGALLGWAPTTDLQVDAFTLTPAKDKLIVGGRFSTVNDVTQRGLGALDLTSGALLPWDAPNTVKNGWGTGDGAGRAGIWGLTTDQNAVYGTGWVFSNASIGNLEGTFSAEPGSGAIRWIADCHGDHYAVYSDGTNVYTTSHEHACETIGGMTQDQPSHMRNASAVTAAVKGTLGTSPWLSSIYADWTGFPAPAAIDWYPDWITGTASGMGQAGWSMVGNGAYLAVGGEFIGVNNQRQQGLVRFAVTPAGGAKQGPRLSSDSWVPTARSVASGSVRVSIPANWDRDDLNLTYKLMRTGKADPVQTVAMKSTYWNTPTVVMNDGSLPAGSTQTYRVVAVDGDGNSATSAPVTVTVSTASASAYAQVVLNDNPSLFWRLGGSGATAATDWAGSNNGVVGTGVGTVNGGSIVGESGAASTFDGTSNGLVSTTSTTSAPGNFSTEAWFKTTSTSGGKLIGYGSSSSGDSSNYDRHVYLDNDGRLTFGTYPNSVKTVRSTASYNDGAWHQVVAAQGSDGMKLYVDGSLVGSDASVTSAQPYSGYWRLGGDNLNGWPYAGSNENFTGAMDEFAVYDYALTAGQVSSHYAAGLGLGVPTASFTSTANGLTASFDASASTPSSGQTISSYSWNFGDGSPAVLGRTQSHVYGSTGSYTTTLTVKDSGGLVATSSTQVSVTAPHAVPVAVIGSAASGLSVS